MAGLILVTPPAIEPILLADAKTHLRVDVTDDDALITGLITSARMACEAFIHGFLITQTWKVLLDAFPTDTSPILLPIEPLQSVSAFTWADTEHVITTMTVATPGAGPFLATDYLLDTDHEPGRLVLPPSNAWPGNSLWPVSPISITCVAGFGSTAASVPQPYIDGMHMCVAHWYENRVAIETSGAMPKEVPMGAEFLWWIGGRYWHLR